MISYNKLILGLLCFLSYPATSHTHLFFDDTSTMAAVQETYRQSDAYLNKCKELVESKSTDQKAIRYQLDYAMRSAPIQTIVFAWWNDLQY
jgi:hypothetical protein